MRNRVRELRNRDGQSQEELAGRLGVSRQTVISIERDRYDPSLTLAIAIARQFKTTVEEVFLVDDCQPTIDLTTTH
jgi:putative transcriptional regulator